MYVKQEQTLPRWIWYRKNNFCYTMKKGKVKICLDNDCRSKWNYSGSANTDRPAISKKHLEENLNDANRFFENKVCSNAFQPVQKQAAKL